MIAIVVVAYNRTDSVSRLLSSLNNAHYSVPAPLIISIDKSKTDDVEKLADSFIWKHGPKRVIKHEHNLGLRNHILSIGKLTEEFDNLIVLEDDLIVSNCFYDYALAAVDKYKDNPQIAGISLYNPNYNFYRSLPFSPRKDEYDAYLMQIAQSWGQIWMRKQWKEFYNWYLKNSEEFGILPHLPINICLWGKNSWLKYHNKYCIEQNKFFVYPYVSLTSNMGFAGAHAKIGTNITRVALQCGQKYTYQFPDMCSSNKYDAFYESLSISDVLTEKDICVDLYGLKQNFESRRYWLTSNKADFKIVKTFGVYYYPIEENIRNNAEGSVIFLYDTTQKERNRVPDNTFELISYYFKIRAIYTNLKRIGFIKFIYKAVIALANKRF